MRIYKNILLVFLALSIVNIAYALSSVTIQTPAAGATISSTSQLVNITFTGGDTVYCQLQATSASTANSTGYDLFNLSNSSSGLSTQVNTTYNFRGFEDAPDYVLTVNCQNETAATSSDTNTGVIINFGTPPAPTALTPTGKQTADNQTFSATVTDVNTTGCTLFFNSINPGSASYAMTYSGSTCTKTFTNMPNTVYNYYVQATDGTDTSNSASYDLEIKEKKGNARKAIALNQALQQGQGKKLGVVAQLDGSKEEKKTLQEQVKKEGEVKELTKTGAGIVGGFIAGSIVPGIGNIVGAIIGGIVGLIF